MYSYTLYMAMYFSDIQQVVFGRIQHENDCVLSIQSTNISIQSTILNFKMAVMINPR